MESSERFKNWQQQFLKIEKPQITLHIFIFANIMPRSPVSTELSQDFYLRCGKFNAA